MYNIVSTVCVYVPLIVFPFTELTETLILPMKAQVTKLLTKDLLIYYSSMLVGKYSTVYLEIVCARNK